MRRSYPVTTTPLTEKVTFTWIEDGAFLVMRQSERPGTPASACWAIGRDESGPAFKVPYSDNRGMSRIYEMSFCEGMWWMWRDNPRFSQRFEGRVSPDGNKIVSHWEKSFDGATWEHDFDITYARLVVVSRCGTFVACACYSSGPRARPSGTDCRSTIVKRRRAIFHPSSVLTNSSS